MSLPDINFENSSPFDGSRHAGFEKMCCQVASLEPASSMGNTIERALTRMRHTAFGCIPETTETVLSPVLRMPSCKAVKIVTNLSWLHHWGEVC